MAEDREVLREIWEGKLPVSFQLSSEEVHTLNVPEPFYLMVPRLLYLPLVVDKVRKHFLQYINPEHVNNDIWFEFNGQPIKWNYPIGLWYDLYAFDYATLPWPIVVHFENYPESKILRCPLSTTKDLIKSHFMSSLKEADALKHKGNVINSMQEREHNQLWIGFLNDRFDQFWSINKKLMESGNGVDGGSGNCRGFRNIPLRIYTGEEGSVKQRQIKPFDDVTGTWTTLQDILIEFFPAKAPPENENDKITAGGGDNSNPISNLRCLVHGIDPPLNTPVQWMSEHLSYPDNFLHIVVHSK